MTPETWSTRVQRYALNWFPAYRATGGRVVAIAGDWSEVRIRLPLNRQTRNYVKTIFGGSLYGSIDPIYMMMLIQILGPDYIVWDKAATIRFRRPGRQTLFATFRLTPEDLASIRATVEKVGKAEPEFAVDLVSATGEVHASFTKLLHVRKRGAPAPSPVVVTGT